MAGEEKHLVHFGHLDVGMGIDWRFVGGFLSRVLMASGGVEILMYNGRLSNVMVGYPD
jgi:hypothetical protein